MKLPIEISPNPLVTSTIELRFSPIKESSELLPLVYREFLEILPNLGVNNLPSELRRTNPQFKYSPDYSMSNENYKVSFSNSVLLFEHISEYQFWKNYFPFISKCYQVFFKIVETPFIERIGVRYASVLDKTEGLNQVLNSVPNLELPKYQHKFEHYRCNIKVDNMNLLLQVFDNAKAVKKDQPLSGVYIDIDASYNDRIEPRNGVLDIIDKLHNEQKRLFFSLLKPEYVETLNPKY